jgi:hypothetical protein
MNQKIIVVDNNTNGVLCQCSTPSVAHSVSSGFINSSIKLIPSNLQKCKEAFNKNYNQPDIFFQYIFGEVYDMKPSLITEQWVSLKKLAMLRNQWLSAWETRCDQFLLNRNLEYAHLSDFHGFLWHELDACDPDNNYYTQSIVEWASISNVSVPTAYQELKLKAESRGLQYVRNHAVHQKFVLLLNQETTHTGFQQVFEAGMDQLIGQAIL